MKIASQEAGLEELNTFLNGPTGVVFGPESYGEVLKELVKFGKETKKSDICGGYVEDQYFDADGIKAIAELPSKEVLQAKLLAGLQAPISSLVGLMGQRLASFVRVLDGIAKKRAEEG